MSTYATGTQELADMRTHTAGMQAAIHMAAMAAIKIRRQRHYAALLGKDPSSISRILSGHIFPGGPINERAARLLARVDPDDGDPLEVLAAKFSPDLDIREAFLFRPAKYKGDSYIRVMEGLLWIKWKYPVHKYAWIDWYERDIRLKPGTKLTMNRYGRPKNPMLNVTDPERPLVYRSHETAERRPRKPKTDDYAGIRRAIMAR